jgi:transcriptional regulator with XRE-family HTH domain
MDDQRTGLALRSVRRRRGLRQGDVARLAHVSQSTVSRIERGHLGPVSTDALRAVCAVVDIRIELVARWRGGDLDRLLNARHSALHELVARFFRSVPGWIVRPEVSFSIYGERGVIDLLAWDSERRALCVIELKTAIADVNELVGVVDRKRRLAARIVADLGWIPASVSVWVIVGDSRTNRRRIQAHGSMLRAAFPADGRAMRGWLFRPERPIAGLSIWPVTHPGTARLPCRSASTGPRRDRCGR